MCGGGGGGGAIIRDRMPPILGKVSYILNCKRNVSWILGINVFIFQMHEYTSGIIGESKFFAHIRGRGMCPRSSKKCI